MQMVRRDVSITMSNSPPSPAGVHFFLFNYGYHKTIVCPIYYIFIFSQWRGLLYWVLTNSLTLFLWLTFTWLQTSTATHQGRQEGGIRFYLYYLFVNTSYSLKGVFPRWLCSVNQKFNIFDVFIQFWTALSLSLLPSQKKSHMLTIPSSCCSSCAHDSC